MQSASIDLGGPTFDLLVKRKSMHDDAEFDITAMIDLVFMMNIYFLVTFLTAALGEVDLPAASHVAALDADSAQILTHIGSLNGESVTVHLGDGKSGEAIADVERQDERIRDYVEQGSAAGKTAVLIKAEKKVRLRELFRVSTAAAVEGIKLHVAVTEKDAGQ